MKRSMTAIEPQPPMAPKRALTPWRSHQSPKAVPNCTPWSEMVLGSVAGAADGTIEDGTHLVGGGLLVEDREPDDVAREVVEDDGNPPAEGPPLGERRGQPWHPEAGTVLYDDRSVRRGNLAGLS